MGALTASAFGIAPQITLPPQPSQIFYRDSAVLKVEAEGENVALQWYAGESGDLSSPVPGATGALLVSQPLLASANFWVRASNPDGHVDSPAAQVDVRPAVSGVVNGMGNNNSRQLYGAMGSTTVPRPMLGGVIAIAAGDRHSLVVKEDHSLWGIGDNGFGQLGSNPSPDHGAPRQMAAEIVHANAGGFHTLYIQSGGSLFGVGYNNFGQLGDGTTTNRTQPYQIASSVADAAGGEFHSAFVKTDGSLWAVGCNTSGQLGDGILVNRSTALQVADGVARVYSSGHHTLFLKTDGSLWGMGSNRFGQLGDGTEVDRHLPVKIADGVIDATCGNTHSLYRTLDNTLRGMGSNSVGQLGLDGMGSGVNHLVPETIAQDVVRVAAGSAHTLFVTSDYVLHTTGANSYGSLGDGSEIPRSEPYVAGFAVAVAGGSGHSLFIDASPVIEDTPDSAVIASGTATTLSVTVAGPEPYTYQWYLGLPGDTGTPLVGAVGSQFTTPALTEDISYWVRISNPYGHVDSGEAKVSIATQPIVTSMSPAVSVPHAGNAVVTVTVAGDHISYQWYAGPSGDTSAPVPGATSDMLVTPPLAAGATFWVRATNAAGTVDSDAVEVAVGPVFKGILSTSGENEFGQLGIGTKLDSLGLREISIEVAAVAAGVDHNFFIKSDGTLWGMGRNSSGELGDGTTLDRTTPVMVASDVASVCPATQKTYFIKSDGSLWAMGGSPPGHPGIIVSPVKIGEGFASVEAGNLFTLAVKTDGSLWGTGSNSNGQLGREDGDSFSTFVRIAGDVVKAAAGQSHTLFVKRDGSLWGVGRNSELQLGVPGQNTHKVPIQIVSSGVKQTAAGWGHSLFLKDDGNLWGTGYNAQGQLGDRGGQVNAPPAVMASGVMDIAAGRYHSMFLKPDRELWMVGGNTSGELADGTTENRFSPIRAASSVVAFAGGWKSSMVLEGRPAILAQPLSGVIINGQQAQVTASADSGVPVTWQWYRGIPGDISSPIEGATGPSCLTPPLLESTFLWARATNEYGYSDTAAAFIEVTYPPAITSFPAGETVAYGESAALSLAATGGALTYRWYEGEPGDVSKPVAVINRPTFVTVPLIAPARYWTRISNLAGSVDSGAVDLAVSPARFANIKATGRNQSGQLGDGTTILKTLPVHITGRVVRMAAGNSHTLFLKDDGTLWGMGYNGSGQIGTTATSTQKVPVQIASDVIDMAAGGGHSLFIKSDGSLWAMGHNLSGQLGTGDNVNRSAPVQVATGVAQVAAGASHSVFVKRDGTSWTMGLNTTGQLGLGVPASHQIFPVPQQVADSIARVAAGEYYTMWIKADGGLWAAGANGSGQYGDGTRSPRVAPGEVATNVLNVACGFDHTLIRKIDSTLWATGSNGSGQLGDGSMVRRLSPVQVATGVASMDAGKSFSMFVTSDGELFGMGLNSIGQLGDGTVTARALPVPLGKAMAVTCGDEHSAILDGRPVIVSQPKVASVQAGQTALLEVTAAGSGPLVYQWYRGNAGDTSLPVAGADTASFETGPLVESGSYWVRVSNAYGWQASIAVSATVSGGGSVAYREWAASKGLDATTLRTTLDPDDDGWSNLLEYALAGDPMGSNDERPLARVQSGAEGTVMVLTHRHRIGAAVALSYEWSPDLVTWQSFTPQVTAEPGNDQIETLHISKPVGPDEKTGFIRVIVSEP